MAVTGKTGADAIWATTKRQRIIIKKYQGKLIAVIAAAEAAAVITSAEAAILVAFVNAAADAEIIWKKLANYSGF